MQKRILGFALAMAAATTAGSAPAESGRVRDVVSPDAIRLTLRGRIETIQLIGLDASDFDRPGKEMEQLYDNAIEYAAGLALGQTVRLEKDPRLPDRNGDGRLQRYIFLPSGGLLNAEIITAGWARVAEKPFFSRSDEFVKLQAEARTSARGIWKGAAPPTGSTASIAKPIKGSTPPPRPAAAMPPIGTPAPKTTPSVRATPAATLVRTTPTPALVAKPTATPAATTAVIKPKPAPAATGTPQADSKVATAAGGPDKDDVMAFMQRWQDAWKAKELESYLSLYAPGFKGDRLNLAGWRARKARVFPKAGTIELVLTDVQISGTADRAEVTFTQDYKSATLADIGTKRMVLGRQSDGWKILRENWSRR